MRKRKFYSLLILFIFFLIVKTTQLIERNKTVETIKINKIEERENKKYSALVTKVIDGDTIKVKFLEPVPEELNIEETIFPFSTCFSFAAARPAESRTPG